MKKILLSFFIAFFAFSWQGNAQVTTFPWSEDFEGTFIPTGWVKELPDAANDITQSTTENHTNNGQYSARFSSYNSSSDYNQYLFSEQIHVTAPSTELTFWHKKHDSAETLEWGISTTTQTSGAVTTWTNISLSSTEWLKSTVDLSAYDGQDVYIAWHYYGNYKYYVYLDDVLIDEPPACTAPSDLAMSDIESTTAAAHWTDGNGCSSSVTLTLTPATPNSPHYVQCGIGSLVLTELSPATEYTLEISNDCSGNPSSSIVFTTACAAMSLPWSEGFENAGSIPNCWNENGDDTWNFSNSGSGNHLGDDGTMNGTTTTNDYFAWIDDSGSAEDVTTLTSPFVDISSLTVPMLSFYEISNNEGHDNSTLLVEVWDGAAWNTVGTFNTNTNNGWEKRDIVLSSLTFTDDARVRFTVTEANSANYYDDIAIDDVTFIEAPACPAPTDLSASGVTNVGADFSWTEVANATAWDLYITTTGGSAPETATTPTVNDHNATSYTWTDGSETTTYDVWVRADCGSNNTDVSTWTGPTSFTTLENCPAPTALTATDITATTVNLGWTTGGASNWEVDIQNAGGSTPTGSGTATNANPTAVSQLLPNHDYEFYVRDFCDPYYSSWVGPFAFTTACDIYTPNYTEDFTNFVPDCWDKADNGDASSGPTGLGSGQWYGSTNLGSGSAKINLYNASHSDWLLSPEFDLSIGGYEAVIDVAVTNYNNGDSDVMGADDKVELLYTEDGSTWTVIHTWTAADALPNSPTRFTIALSSTGTNVQFGILATDGPTDDTEDYDFHVDEFTIQTPPACPAPTGLSANSETNVGADFSWTEAANATVWDLYIATTGGSAPEAATTPTVNDHNATTYTWTGGSETTTYDVWVRADCGSNNNDVSTWTGPTSFTTLENCPAPTAGISDNITANEADLAWTAGADESNWNVEWKGGADFTPGTSAEDGNTTTTSESYALASLIGNTTYYWYVQADCADGGGIGESTWAGPFTFTTACDVYTPDYTEDFTTYVPDCWEEATGPITGPTSTGSSRWYPDGFANDGSSGAARINLFYKNNVDWLISPTFDLTGGGFELKFDVAVTAYSGTTASDMGSDDQVILLQSIDDGATWTTVQTWDVNNTPSNTGDNIIIDISGITSATTIFAFWANEGDVDDDPDYNFYVDNFVIQTPPSFPDCATTVSPTDASSLAPTDECTNEMILEWAASATGTAPASYDVYFGTPGNLTLVETVTAPTTTSIVDVTLGATHAWKIVPIDANGNTPQATCGEWTFTVEDPNSGNDSQGAGSGGYDFANLHATGTTSIPTYGWIDPVAAGHTEVTAWTDGDEDDGYYTIPDIGFTFPFYGTDYQTGDVHICTNGYITFGTPSISTASIISIPSTSDPDNMIAVLAMDLDDGDNGKVYYGTDNNGNFVVTWWHYIDYAHTEYMTFQVLLLNDGNGTIKMQYNDTESTSPLASAFSGDALIGIENADGSDGAQYRNNGDGGPILCSPMAIGFSTNPSTLPVELTSFTGYAKGTINIVNWSTASERNVEYYSIERSTDGKDFAEIGQVKAANNSTEILHYSFADTKPVPFAYYRLRSLDFDGKTQLSSVVTIKRANDNGIISVYPVPTKNAITLNYNVTERSNVTISITDIAGKVMKVLNFNAEKGINSQNISINNFAAGTYFLQLNDGINIFTERIVKD